MTHKPVTVLPDGTHKYASYHTYRPVPPEERVNAVRRPDDPRAVRFHGQWFLPLDVLPDDERVFPETVPDDACLEHQITCRCEVCSRPQATRLWQRHLGIRSTSPDWHAQRPPRRA